LACSPVTGSKGIKVLSAFSVCDDLFNIKDLLSLLKIMKWADFFSYFRADLFLNIYGPERGLIFQFLLCPKRVESSHFQVGYFFDGMSKKEVKFPANILARRLVNFFSDQTFVASSQESHVSKNIFRYFEMSLKLKFDANFIYQERFLDGPSRSHQIVLSPFSTWVGRNWRVERWIELIRFVRIEFPEYQITIFGSMKEKVMNEARLVVDSSIKFIAAEDYKEILEISKNAALIISNDSMMTHVASFLGKPCISFFGPNTPNEFGATAKGSSNLYYPLECSPCKQGTGAQKCLKGYQTCLGLDMIEINEVQRLISKNLDLPEKMNMLKQ
jgi:ADP-heptose:LPS heptosyltransferase